MPNKKSTVILKRGGEARIISFNPRDLPIISYRLGHEYKKIVQRYKVVGMGMKVGG